jgi:hypothetical protein
MRAVVLAVKDAGMAGEDFVRAHLHQRGAAAGAAFGQVLWPQRVDGISGVGVGLGAVDVGPCRRVDDDIRRQRGDFVRRGGQRHVEGRLSPNCHFMLPGRLEDFAQRRSQLAVANQ